MVAWWWCAGIATRCSNVVSLFKSLEVLVLQPEGVNVTWEVAKNGETDVDENIGAAAFDEKHSERRDWQC